MKLILNIKNQKNSYLLSLRSKSIGKIMGSCVVLKRTYKINKENFYYLSELYMKEQNKGYGSIFMRKVQSWCAKRKKGIFLCAIAYPSEKHKKLIKFYRRLDFTYFGSYTLDEYKPNKNVMLWTP